MDHTKAYPLDWPAGWPRTSPHKVSRNWAFKVSPSKAYSALFDALRRLGARHVVVSTNQILNGAPCGELRQKGQITGYLENGGQRNVRTVVGVGGIASPANAEHGGIATLMRR